MRVLLCALFFFISQTVFSQSNISWNMAMSVAPSSSGNNHPRIATDGNGNPLVLWWHASRAMFSRWNGTAFTAPVLINPATMTVAGAGWMGPDIAAHGDTVYVVFKQSPEGSDSSHIFCARSFDGGQTFNTPVRLLFQTTEVCDEEELSDEGILDSLFAEAELFADASSVFRPDLN